MRPSGLLELEFEEYRDSDEMPRLAAARGTP